MAEHDDQQHPFDQSKDPFAPPAIPCEVQCVHCGESYESWQIEWRPFPDGTPVNGAWCCPTPDCDGIGFGFDIFPVDPAWTDENGERLYSADEGDEDDDDEDEDDSFEYGKDWADDDEDATPVDEFDADAFWLESKRWQPRRHGHTPQPPFKHGSPPSAEQFNTFDDDDIPF